MISMMSAMTPTTTPSLRCLETGRLETISRFAYLQYLKLKFKDLSLKEN